MNSIFNINRFLKYSKTFVETHSKQYLYSLLIVGGYTMVGLLLFILVPMLVPYISIPIIYSAIPLSVVVIVLAPCFFEKTISKNNSIFDFILPVSYFEKFLVRLLNYVLIIPVLILGTVYILSQTAALLSSNNADAIINAFDVAKIFTYKELLMVAIFQSFYWVGYYYFKRYALIKSTVTIIGYMLVVTALSLLVSVLTFGDFDSYKAVDVSVDITASNLDYVTTIPQYILALLFPLGPWIVCMLKIRETEI